jgi:alpha-L-rhamnosidase
VVGFLHRYTAGIRLGDDPAYRSFRIEPVPGGGLTSAEAAHESPYGRIESAWTLTDDGFALDVLVPAGTWATVVLPDGSRHPAGPGRHRYLVPRGRRA